jgi:hypothetical protein
MNIKNDIQPSLDKEIQEVFCAYGKAVYEASGIEKSIVQVFVIYAFDPSNPKAVEIVANTIDQKDKLTLGSLIRNSRKELNLPARINEQLDDVLEKRNWLIHHFYFDAYSKMIDREARKELIKLLESLAQRFGSLNDLLIAEIVRRMIDKGVSQHVLDQLAKDVIVEIEG